MATGHTVKAFDDDLNHLRAAICEMGGLAEAAIRESMEALVRRDSDARQLAQMVRQVAAAGV